MTILTETKEECVDRNRVNGEEQSDYEVSHDSDDGHRHPGVRQSDVLSGVIQLAYRTSKH